MIFQDEPSRSKAVIAAERNDKSELAEKNRELRRLYQSGKEFRESE